MRYLKFSFFKLYEHFHLSKATESTALSRFITGLPAKEIFVDTMVPHRHHRHQQQHQHQHQHQHQPQHHHQHHHYSHLHLHSNLCSLLRGAQFSWGPIAFNSPYGSCTIFKALTSLTFRNQLRFFCFWNFYKFSKCLFVNIFENILLPHVSVFQVETKTHWTWETLCSNLMTR